MGTYRSSGLFPDNIGHAHCVDASDEICVFALKRVTCCLSLCQACYRPYKCEGEIRRVRKVADASLRNDCAVALVGEVSRKLLPLTRRRVCVDRRQAQICYFVGHRP